MLPPAYRSRCCTGGISRACDWLDLGEDLSDDEKEDAAKRPVEKDAVKRPAEEDAVKSPAGLPSMRKKNGTLCNGTPAPIAAKPTSGSPGKRNQGRGLGFKPPVGVTAEKKPLPKDNAAESTSGSPAKHHEGGGSGSVVGVAPSSGGSTARDRKRVRELNAELVQLDDSEGANMQSLSINPFLNDGVRDADQCLSFNPGNEAAGKCRYKWKVARGVRAKDISSG
jgi:hypothetical protein